MEKKLIERFDKIDEFLSMFILIPFGVLFIPLKFALEKFINNNILLVFLLIIIKILLFSGAFIGALFMILKARKIIFKNIEIVKYKFYKINNNYFSKNWEISKEIFADEIISLNNKIETTEKYFLIFNSLKKIEISKEQYIELNKVANIENKPLLKLNEKEYKNIENNILETFIIYS